MAERRSSLDDTECQAACPFELDLPQMNSNMDHFDSTQSIFSQNNDSEIHNQPVMNNNMDNDDMSICSDDNQDITQSLSHPITPTTNINAVNAPTSNNTPNDTNDTNDPNHSLNQQLIQVIQPQTQASDISIESNVNNNLDENDYESNRHDGINTNSNNYYIINIDINDYEDEEMNEMKQDPIISTGYNTNFADRNEDDNIVKNNSNEDNEPVHIQTGDGGIITIINYGRRITNNADNRNSLNNNENDMIVDDEKNENWINNSHYYNIEAIQRNINYIHTLSIPLNQIEPCRLKSIETIMKINPASYNNINYIKTLQSRAQIFFWEKQLDDSLQGNVYSGYDRRTLRRVIIKRSKIRLVLDKKHSNGGTIEEDIREEAKILQFLQDKDDDADAGFARFVDFFHDDIYFYLITEHGGVDSLNYFVSIHKQVLNRNVSIDELKIRVQYYFKQLVRVIYYLHIIRGIAHLDIKLENSVIDLTGESLQNGDPRLRIIDFGVARIAWNNDDKWKFNKIVGTLSCMAPEILSLWKYRNRNGNNNNKKVPENMKYDPKKADIWSVGVMLLTMLVGLRLWDPREAIKRGKDPLTTHEPLKRVLNGNLGQILIEKHRDVYVTLDAFDLLTKIFTSTRTRIDIKDIMKHPYVRDAPTTLKNNGELSKIIEGFERDKYS